jgi:hypothetical protein
MHRNTPYMHDAVRFLFRRLIYLFGRRPDSSGQLSRGLKWRADGAVTERGTLVKGV